MMMTGVLLLLVALTLAVLIASDTSRFNATDRPLNSALRWPAEQADWLAEALRVLAEVGSPTIATIVGTVFGIALVVAGRRWWAAFFAVVAVGSVVITEVMKRLVQRPRPQWPDPLAVETSFGFPSGHTTSGITMWMTMGIIVLLAFDLSRWRSLLGWFLVGFGVFLGVSRLLLGVHWVTDVLGGWLFGFGWLLLVSGVSLRLYYRRR